MTRGRRETEKQIAIERIHILFEGAKKVYHKNPMLAQRYINLAKKICKRYRVRLPAEYKRQICRKCKSLLIPGTNCRVRTRQKREPHIVITCLNCGGQMRIPIRRRENESSLKKET